MTKIIPTPGSPLPLGASIHDRHVRFSVFSRHATRVWLMIFDHPDDDKPAQEFEFDPTLNKTGDIWHLDLYGAGEGLLYLYRMDGPYETMLGHRFNPNAGLIDPYARALTGPLNSDCLCEPNEAHYACLPKCLVVEDAFNWQGDKPLNRALRHTIIYEMHAKGYTAHPSSGVTAPGTYAAIVEKIPHLQELGITAVELLPVQAFDHGMFKRRNPLTGEPLTNFWGYNPVNFFAVELSYSSATEWGQHIHEFKWMVRELHKAGIEVILDVVYNHSAEGNHIGPTFSFKGIDNQIYYLLEDDRRYYKNFSGTGNTVNCNHPVVRDLILDSLRHWVIDMHVDGFRFDLASVLGRDQNGEMLENPPIVERIAEDPILRNTKIIAEAWDAAGAYQVGAFPGRRWAEWNGRYRDDIRRFWRGDAGMVGALATRLAGSSDLYLDDGRTPCHSINFITSHDGFTLNDWVSYNQKHNLANGENNHDGDSNNFSDNLGVEGPTDDVLIEERRVRRIKNMLATLMLSQGVPMLLAGDEFRRTQQGNNNAYAQDNEISWVDWNLKDTHSDIFRFTRELIAFRKLHPIFYRSHFFVGQNGNELDIQWLSPNLAEPDWGGTGHTLMCLINGEREIIGENRSDNDALLLFNNSSETTHFHLPPAPGGKAWRLVLDTAQPTPFDIRLPGKELSLPNQSTYTVKAESLVVMLSSGETV